MAGRQPVRPTRKPIEHRAERFDADFRVQEQQRLPASAFNQLDADVVDNDGGRWIGGHRLCWVVVMPTWPLRGLDVTFIELTLCRGFLESQRVWRAAARLQQRIRRVRER